MRAFRGIVWEGEAGEAARLALELGALADRMEAANPPAFLFLKNLSEQLRKFAAESEQEAKS